MTGLPDSWTEEPLAKLLAEPLANGRSVPDGDGFPVLRLSALRSGHLDFEERKLGHWSAHDADPFLVRHNDLLVARGNGSIRLVGRAGLVRFEPPAVAFPDTMIRVRPDPGRIGPRFLAHQWEATRTRSQVERAARTTAGIYKISQGDLRELRFAVPPLDDQDLIVAAIETNFSRLDAAVASLTRAKANVKRARASVLKAAVEGRLVPTEAEIARAEGREYEPASVLLERILVERKAAWTRSGARGKYQEPVKPEVEGLAEVPEGWCWATLEQLGQGARPFAYGVLVPGPDMPDGVPFVRVGDIGDGVVADRPEKAISRAVADQFRRTYLQGGELLMSIVGTIGRVGIASAKLKGANVARAVGVLPLVPSLCTQFVMYAIRSPETQHRLVGAAHEVARKTLNMEDVRAAALSLPPLAEQHRIVAEVDRRLSVLDALDATLDGNLARCARLRQSILKSAFEGRLVPAEPQLSLFSGGAS